MIYEELKRRLFNRFVLFSIIGILILTIGLNLLVVRESGNIDEFLKEEATYCGEMTEDKLWFALQKVRDEKVEEVKYGPFITLMMGLVAEHPGILYNETRIKDYPDDYGKNFYMCWRKKAIAIIENIPKQEQKKALKELNKVKTPFVKYEGCEPWNIGIGNFKALYFAIIFLVTFFAATTYSDSIEDGSMEIICSAKFGKRMMIIRLLPVAIYGLILTLIATFGTVFMIGSVAGFRALKSSFKVFALFSIGNFTLGQGMVLIFISEILGILALTTVMGWISYKTEKTNLAISIGIGVNMLYIIMCFIYIPWSGFQFLKNLLPMASSQVMNAMGGFQFYRSFWAPYVVMINMGIIFIVFGMMLYHSIYKDEF